MDNHRHNYDLLVSPRESEDARQVTDESPTQFFLIGKRLMFSTSSISLSAEEMKSLEEVVKKLDEEGNCEEAEPQPAEEKATPPPDPIIIAPETEPKTNEKPGSPWGSGFIRKLKKRPTMNIQSLQSNMPRLRSLKILSKRRVVREEPDLPVLPPNLNLGTELYYCFQNSWTNFSLSVLKEATDNFSRENMIGEGGYSEVYKGILEDGQLVAVKRLIRGTTEEMTADYLSELGILVHVNHPNIANVIGYGVEGGMHVVLPLSPNGSLSTLLKGNKEKLTWNLRHNIALGIASGLSYLHEGCQRRIIHRDIKSANILLTEDFEPMISDFGLAKWLPDQWTHLTASQVEGTFGYLPPEFFLHGIVDEKTDVYAYGVLLLELISGRPAIDESSNSLVMWAMPKLNSNNTMALVDPSLGGTHDSQHINSMVMAASLCVHHDPEERPQMSQVLKMLNGDDETGTSQSKKELENGAGRNRAYLDLIMED